MPPHESTSVPSEPPARRRTTTIMLGVLFAIVGLHLLLTASIAPTQTATLQQVHLLRPLVTLGSVGVMVAAALRIRDPQRQWAWTLQAVALLGAIVFVLLYTFGGILLTSPLLQVLAGLIYLNALGGSVLYFRRVAWQVGSRWRIVLGGVTVGWASLILLLTVIPYLEAERLLTGETRTIVCYLAYDMGILFVVTLLGLRYGAKVYPLHTLGLGLTCLLAADLSTFFLFWSGQRLPAWNQPLYALQTVLLAWAASVDATRTMTVRRVALTALSSTEWAVWTFIPLGIVLLTLALAGTSGSVQPLVLIGLVVVAVAHEVLALWDYRRVWQALAAANAELATVNRQLADYATQAEERAMLEERNRVAREIHDGLGHYLTAIDAQLEAGRTLLDHDGPRAQTFLHTAQHLTREGLTEVRRSVAALRQSSIPTGLHEALGPLIAASTVSGTATSLQVEGSVRPLPAHVQQTLYRAVQEGLTNVRKHAPGSAAEVVLDYRTPEVLRLTITDDGPGSDALTGGFGLMSLRERVEQIGGTVTIASRPGYGFEIVLEVAG